MQALPQNGYTRQQVLDALRGTEGTRHLSFRYERLSSANLPLGDLDGVVLGGQVDLNALADIRRTAKFTVDADAPVAWLSDRIRPWARLEMPISDETYDSLWTSADQSQTLWSEPFRGAQNAPLDPVWSTTGNAYQDGAELVLPALATPTSVQRAQSQLGVYYGGNDWYVEFAITPPARGNGGRYGRFEVRQAAGNGHYVRVDYTTDVDGSSTDFAISHSGYNGVVSNGNGSIGSPTKYRVGVDNHSVFVDLYLPVSQRWTNAALFTASYEVDLSGPMTLTWSSGYTGTETDDAVTLLKDVSLHNIGRGLMRLTLDGQYGIDSTVRLNDFSASAAGAVPGARGIVSGSSWNFTAASSGYLGVTNPMLNGLEQLTVVGWYEHTSGANADAEIFSAFASGGGQVVELKLLGGGSTFFGRVLVLLGDGSGYVNCTVTGAANLQTPGPHCLAMTWQSGVGMTIYLDGEPIPVGSSVGQTQVGAIYAADVMRIGAGPDVFPAYFNGRIDDVSVFGRVLSPQEVRGLYRSGLKLGEYGSTNYCEWPQGVFLLSSPKRAVDEGGAVTREVEAYDQLLVYSDDLISARYSVAAATNYVTAVLALLAAGDRVVVATAKTLPAAMEWPPGTSKLRIINDLLGAINYQALTFDEYGRAVVQPYQPPSERPPEYEYLDDETSVIDPAAESTFDLFQVPNRWVLVVSNPDRPALTSTYTNSSPTSLTSTVTRGRTITDYREEQDAADQATLDAKVARLAFEASQVYETVEFATAVMPIHGDLDVYDLAYERLVVGGKYTETSWSMPLAAGAQMKHSARRVVTV